MKTITIEFPDDLAAHLEKLASSAPRPTRRATARRLTARSPSLPRLPCWPKTSAWS